MLGKIGYVVACSTFSVVTGGLIGLVFNAVYGMAA